MKILFAIIFLFAVYEFIVIKRYKRTSYFAVTHKPYFNMKTNAGDYGEYMTYKHLASYEKDGARFLFNCYILKENGETTEIDVLMIHKTGIYVFESKNYSGWIFGNEKARTWTQCLPNGRKSHKEHFLNPIFQNKLHIKCLRNIVDNEIPMYSIVVFSDRCTLKSGEVDSPDVKVTYISLLYSAIKKMTDSYGEFLSDKDIEIIYNKLYKSTQVSADEKQIHIENIINAHQQHNIDTFDEYTSLYEEEKLNLDEKGISEPEVQKNIEEEFICPRCGAKLVCREAKHGNHAGNVFYGCSMYPKCRYIKNI